MANNNQSALGGSYPTAGRSWDSSSKANDMTYGGGGNYNAGDKIECDDGEGFQPEVLAGEMHAYIGTRPTSAIQYTAGQLEYAKTCLKKSVEVEGYSIDNEFEEEHYITVEDVSYNYDNWFDAAKHSDAVLSNPSCGEGLRFRLNVEDLGKGVFEELWDLPPDVNQFDYFYGLGLMELICQEYIPKIPNLADAGCIAGHLINFDYWYQLSEEVFVEDPDGPDERTVGDEIVRGFLYPKDSYIKVMPNGEFEGKFEFENEEDVPIKECDEFYEVKDIVKLDINGKWVEKRPDEGPINNGGTTDSPGNSPGNTPSGGPSDEDKKCVIKHEYEEESYSITAISDQEPITYSYDYGDVATSDIEETSAMPPFYYPEDNLAFIPVWDEVCFVEGVVPKVNDSEGPLACPKTTATMSREKAVLDGNVKPAIIAEKIWHIDFWNGVPCSTILDEGSQSPDESDECGYFTAQMLNPLSGVDGPGLVAEYFRGNSGTIQEGTYKPLVKAPNGDNDDDEEEIVKVPVVIDCFDGNPKVDGGNSDGPNCTHCDCHDIIDNEVIVNVGCDPCQKCGNGIGLEVKEGEDFYHIQNACPDELLVSDHCTRVKCDTEENLSIQNDLELIENTEYEGWDVTYAYRNGDSGAVWDYSYKIKDFNKVSYAEKDTYRCIITYSGGCVDGMDFMKKTPELFGSSDLTATYRKIVSADEFNKCGEDRLPSLSYGDSDLVKVEGFGSGGEKLDFFPKAAVATKVELNVLDGGLGSYGLNDAQQLEITQILDQMYDTEAVVHKTQVNSQSDLCGMGSVFINRRNKNTDPLDYSVSCKWDQYLPSHYAHNYLTVNKDDYKTLLEKFDSTLEDFEIGVADGKKIIMSHFFGPGQYCKERVDRATRVPEKGGYKITNGYDNFGFFGCRFVNPVGQGDGPNDPAGNCDGTVMVIMLVGLL